MAEQNIMVERLVEALNSRDFAAVADMCDEDVAVSGIGEGADNGREALRERLARHFQLFDETYGDALVMTAEGGSPISVRLTARGRYGGGAPGLSAAAGQSYSVEKLMLIELAEGRIARLALFSDTGELARQLSK
ncbi:ester cyclase [Sinorhizobium sp. BG8]|uniref:nuclear transport factor 2 family protein n=1 Tax=Sinorhizobium sp. BG8 TaxID=2613773 RepID=UPI00193E059F|nr:ester cyclase [Sinorhizobium sp. BG8]